jgi:hypothetical protein
MIAEPITVTNVLQKKKHELANFLNVHVLSNKLPPFLPNYPVDLRTEIVPRLAKYANDRAYCGELYNVVISAYYDQKINKENKQNYDKDAHLELEAKKEILHRTVYALDRLYEAASRLLTGMGVPDSRMNRYD